MKRFFMVVLGLLHVMVSFSQNVSKQEALQMADVFFQSQNRVLKECAAVVSVADDTLLYVFNAENSFVVVAADKSVPPILAFSDHNLYNPKDIVAPAQMWIDHYSNQILNIKKGNALGVGTTTWTKLYHHGVFRNAEEVDPLVKSHWGQGTFYNYYCPRDVTGTNNRVVTGCVATAMAQLIYYFRFPNTGVGSYSYMDSTYGVQSVDYGAATYNYEAMCDDPTMINTEISKLIYNFGVGVDMVYGPDGSGMYNHSAARVLRTYFKYSPQTEYLYRDSTQQNWDSVIVDHLRRNIPMYYAGWSLPNINGHGFVCDGYKLIDSSYYFHFNFGWDGAYDGYFYTAQLTVGGSNFNLAQELIVNAYPDTNLYDYPVTYPLTGSKVLTSWAGSFSDGARDFENYHKNMDYSWQVRPEEGNAEAIGMDVSYSLAAGDTLWIDAPNVNTEYVLTQDTGHLNFLWNSAEINVRFKSDDENESKGFQINYNAVIDNFCQGTQIYTTPSGVITDGSEAQNYSALSTCIHKIVLPNYSAITLHINNLDLEENRDYLYIYKFPVKNENLLMTLTGTMMDTTIVFNEKRLMLSFESDEQHNASGFEIDYDAGYTGIDELSNGLVCGPNPVDNQLFIRATQHIDYVKMYDMQGRLIVSQFVDDVEGVIPTQQLAKGTYTLQVYCGKQVVHKKVIKQ